MQRQRHSSEPLDACFDVDAGPGVHLARVSIATVN
jgi:hypothetical protein